MPVLVVAVVLSVKVALAAVVPVIDAEAGSEHVGVETAAAGVTTQLRATLPVKPPVGVNVIVDVPLLPCATAMGPLFDSV